MLREKAGGIITLSRLLFFLFLGGGTLNTYDVTDVTNLLNYPKAKLQQLYLKEWFFKKATFIVFQMIKQSPLYYPEKIDYE